MVTRILVGGEGKRGERDLVAWSIMRGKREETDPERRKEVLSMNAASSQISRLVDRNVKREKEKKGR